MINKLRSQYPSLVVEEMLPTESKLDYFRLDNGLYVGIHKDELTEKDRNLLSIFLTPIMTDNHLSIEQSLWKQVILTNHKEALLNLTNQYGINSNFRHIHFHLQNEVDISSFERAILSISLFHSILVWLGPCEGIIIEQIKHDMVPEDELLNLRNAITSDFYTDFYIYIGEIFSLQQPIHDLYNWESRCFHLSRSLLKNKGVYQFYETIPYILLRDTKDETRNRILTLVRDYTKEELQIIKIFIESGLNISLAAKKVFMHRNSLQYRVDKFTEKSGIDIKSFHGALVVYLAILSKNF
jgi:sugar diacid utilization regulator